MRILARLRVHPASTIITLSGAFLFACLLYAASIPLAFLLGPLIFTAALSLMGFDVRTSLGLRKMGQLTVGATAGLNLTSTILAQLFAWLPLMLASSIMAVLASALISVLFGIWANVDRMSAYYAGLPGGLAEMANIGAEAGADPEPIAVAQTVRVGFIVVVVPPTLVLFGVTPGGPATIVPSIDWIWLPVLIAGGGAFAYVLGAMRLNNPWMIGATIWAAALTSSGIVSGHMPQPIFLLAQYLIGTAVGSRFRPFMIRRLPRVTAFSIVTVAMLGLVMIGFSAVLIQFVDLDLTTAILATSPGGMSEMAATAEALHLAIATVVAFQVVRAMTVNAFAMHFWNGLNRIRFFDAAERLFGKKAPPVV